MIETKQIDLAPQLEQWLQTFIAPHLKPDVSNYAKGRLRVWLGTEPSLGTGPSRPGLHMPDLWERFQERLEWKFDYCLITYSGTKAIGITPHRDASYADYEAYGLNLVGNATFRYWNDRRSFGKAPGSGVKHTDPPTDVLQLVPGTVVRFNSKNLHSCEPEANRWAANFWKAKPTI